MKHVPAVLLSALFGLSACDSSARIEAGATGVTAATKPASAVETMIADGADAARDQEIDDILNTITKDADKKPTPPVMNKPQRKTAKAKRPVPAPELVSLPPSLSDDMEPMTDLQKANAAEHAALFPKPYWRREIEAQRAGRPVTDPMPRGY
jgi:hypothetical protein